MSMRVALESLSDDVLENLARHGDPAARRKLWRRHGAAAVMVARFVAPMADHVELARRHLDRTIDWDHDGEDGRLAFRPDLLSSILNAPRGAGSRAVARATTGHPGSMVGAFRSLEPYRQTVLWCTDVESLPRRRVAAFAGIPVEDTAREVALAREALGRQWILRRLNLSDLPEVCRETTMRFGRSDVAAHSPEARHIGRCVPCSIAASAVGDSRHLIRLLVAPAVLGGLPARRLQAWSGALERTTTHMTLALPSRGERRGEW